MEPSNHAPQQLYRPLTFNENSFENHLRHRLPYFHFDIHDN